MLVLSEPKIPELAELKTNRPELYHELEILSKVENTVARGFKYGMPFAEIDRKVNEYIAGPQYKQLSIFDD